MRHILLATAFIEGAVVMILELAGSRIIAPYLGTSIIIWTSLIGVILASLSIGYYIGGKWADRNPDPVRLSRLILFAAFFISLIIFFKPFLIYVNPSSFGELMLSAVLLTLALFAPPTIALGMVTPTIAKLLIKDMSTSGSTIGSLYALSTMGSIVGTFLGGFILISFFGSTKILIVLSTTLFIVSCIIYVAARKNLKTVAHPLIALLILTASLYTNPLAFGQMNTLTTGTPILDTDTRYGRIWIYDTEDSKTGRPVRYMTDTIYATQSGIFKDEPDTLLFSYMQMFDLATHFRPELSHALMIGAGMYSYPKHFLKTYPKATLDIAEIDPALKKLATTYFGFAEHPRLSIFHEDGRNFLNRVKEPYDVLFLDAFHSEFSIPYQLTTKEAVQKMHAALDADGVVIVNSISAVEGWRAGLLHALLKTYQSVFADVRVFKVNKETPNSLVQNVLIVAFKNADHAPLTSPDPTMQSYLERVVAVSPEANLPILTDDFAPIERLMARMLF